MASTQMERFGQALLDYSEGRTPTDYAFDSTAALAAEIAKDVLPNQPAWKWAIWGGNRVLARQREDLALLGIRMDNWSRESDLHDAATQSFRFLAAMGKIYEEGLNGPICCNCAHPVVPEQPCVFCMATAETVSPLLVAVRDHLE